MPLRNAEPTEALVMIPGLGTDARLFDHAIARLSQDRPVTLALPVRGERVEDIAAGILPHLPPRVALVGHGLGGIVALELLRRIPKRVARLALIACKPFPETPAEAADRETRMIALRAGRVADWVKAEFGASVPGDPATRTAILGRLTAMAETLGPEAVLRQSRALQRRGDYQGVLRRCAAPIAFICGDADPINPIRRQDVLAGLVPDATLTRIDGAGHFPMLDAPDAVTAALEAALEAPFVLR
ncbi:alpha/beta fold hydrolase [Roseivivax sp. CAU 1753]